ncbi:hypothetical protein GCM10011492_40150 [Flexivirga endophytica]|uniref:Uncharacterized protein n=1 Tax=Flexivirga endophytica TaxID=1849103 RepID=A0A916TGY1_9MICO|nr:hypothetical protein GCM10011492_40150 [Flexivirga endophytica]
MDHLAVQVAQLDDVVVDDSQPTDSGAGQIGQHRSCQTSRADNEHAGIREFALAGHPDLGQQRVPRISLGLVAVAGRTAA